LAGEAKRLSPEEEKRLRTRAAGDGDVGVGGVVVACPIHRSFHSIAEAMQERMQVVVFWWCAGAGETGQQKQCSSRLALQYLVTVTPNQRQPLQVTKGDYEFRISLSYTYRVVTAQYSNKLLLASKPALSSRGDNHNEH
jgi:hypothetical protein